MIATSQGRGEIHMHVDSKKILVHMAALNMSRTDLSRRMKVPRTRIFNILETGTCNSDEAAAICRVLAVRPETVVRAGTSIDSACAGS